MLQHMLMAATPLCLLTQPLLVLTRAGFDKAGSFAPKVIDGVGLYRTISYFFSPVYGKIVYYICDGAAAWLFQQLGPPYTQCTSFQYIECIR